MATNIVKDSKGRFIKGHNFWLGKKKPKGLAEKTSKSIKKLWKNPEYRKRMSNAHITKGKPLCKDCGKKLVNYAAIFCKLHVKKGSRSPSWKGGVSTANHIIRNSIEYRLWRIAVFTRDDYTCQKCNIKGGELNADHIKPFSLYPELRLAIDNGRTLCVSCHRQTDTWGVVVGWKGLSS